LKSDHSQRHAGAEPGSAVSEWEILQHSVERIHYITHSTRKGSMMFLFLWFTEVRRL